MNRRALLVAGGLGVATALVGCLDEPGADDGGTGADGGDGADDRIVEEPRIDDPPYDIDTPEQPEPPDDAEWNDDYLGENMPTEPSLRVERLSVARGGIRDPIWDHADPDGDGYAARLLTDESDIDAVFDTEAMGDDAVDRLRAVEFDDAVVVAVESGFGSGSVGHRWARAEADGSVIDLHGYYTTPYIQTDDITSRLSVLEIERPPEGPEYARVNLTVAEDRRVRFNSTEGVVITE